MNGNCLACGMPDGPDHRCCWQPPDVKQERINDLERRLRRINAINDNPARFDREIDELSNV